MFFQEKKRCNWVYSTITKHTDWSTGSKPRALHSSMKPPRTLITSLTPAVPPLLFYKKVNRRQGSIDRFLVDLQPGGDPRDSGCDTLVNGSRPCVPSSSVPLVTERRMCLPSEWKDSLCWLSQPPHSSWAHGAAAELLLTSVRKHRF